VQNSIVLREATAEDLPFLAHLYRDTRRQELEGWGWPREQQEWFLQMQFDARQRSYETAFPDARDRLICVEGAPVGRLLVNREQAALHLIDIALLEKHRNQGVGRQLIGQLQKECARDGFTLRLQVLEGNPAIRLYRRLGFTETGTEAMYLQMAWTPTDRLGELRMTEHLTADDFAPYVQTRFQVSGTSDFELVLASVKDCSNTRLEQFSLAFLGRASPWLPQGQYKLEHEQMGECELFLVPNGPDADGMRYEASFSRFVEAPGASSGEF